MVAYKEKCRRCKKNYVLVTWKQRYVICYDCQKQSLQQEISDPAMKKLFNIPEEMYKNNIFLRNIKLSYLQFGTLTEKQIDAFKKAVKKMKESHGFA